MKPLPGARQWPTAHAPELLCGQVMAFFFFLILAGSDFLVDSCVGGKADSVCQGEVLCLLCRKIICHMKSGWEAWGHLIAFPFE